jgi:hypothetical protein
MVHYSAENEVELFANIESLGTTDHIIPGSLELLEIAQTTYDDLCEAHKDLTKVIREYRDSICYVRLCLERYGSWSDEFYDAEDERAFARAAYNWQVRYCRVDLQL